MYYVYSIKIDGRRRYIGMTNDIKRRAAEHNRDSKAPNPKRKFYKMVQKNHPDAKLTLDIMATYDSKLAASRYEAYLILDDYFNRGDLWNKPPVIIKYF